MNRLSLDDLELDLLPDLTLEVKEQCVVHTALKMPANNGWQIDTFADVICFLQQQIFVYRASRRHGPRALV